jgi:hypothetical protein
MTPTNKHTTQITKQMSNTNPNKTGGEPRRVDITFSAHDELGINSIAKIGYGRLCLRDDNMH